MDIPNTIALVWQQVVSSLRVLSDRTAQICAATTLVMTVVSIANAPEVTVGAGTWIALLLVGALAMLTILTFVASRSIHISSADRQHRQTAAVTFAVVALVINFFFSFWSTALLAAAIIALARQSRTVRPGVFPWIMCATIVTLIPWWVWTALGAWDAGLVILLPLAALAFISGGHIREAYSPPPVEERLISTRGHRYGAWMGMLLGGILIVTAGLIGQSSYAWIALGGISMAIGVALEAGVRTSDSHPGRNSALISDSAFVIAAICWLTSIT